MAEDPLSVPQQATPPLPVSDAGRERSRKMRTRTKVLLWVLGVVVVVVALGGVAWAIYGRTIGSMITIQYLVRRNGTMLNVTPSSRSLTPVVPATSTTFSALGLVFSAPWAGVSSAQEKGNPPSLVTISFINNKQLTLMKMATSSEYGSLYNMLHAANDYEVKMDAYNATPDQVNVMTPGNVALLTAALLILKSTLLPSGAFLYDFNAGPVEGFQYGDPVAGKWITEDIYNQAGGEFILSTMNASQGEIDYILASRRPQ